jgi:hypothetical protein
VRDHNAVLYNFGSNDVLGAESEDGFSMSGCRVTSGNDEKVTV